MSTAPEPAPPAPRRRRWPMVLGTLATVALLGGLGFAFLPDLFDPPVPPPAEAKALAEGNTAFAVDLFKEVAKTEKGNVILSPYSVSSALGMAYAGARGNTADQMRKTLHFDLPDERLHAAFGGTTNWLTKGRKPYELRIANALWVQQGLGLEPDFVATTNRHYKAGFREIDYLDRVQAAKTINGWVADETKGRIKKILEPDDLIRVVLTLTNAIYFRGQWKVGFDKKDTIDLKFEPSPDVNFKVPMMQHKLKDGEKHDPKKPLHRESSTANWMFLELPYQGDELAMVFMLPKKRHGSEEAVGGLTITELNEGLEKLHDSSRPAKVPRFKFNSKSSLVEPLKKLGMTDAFDDRTANFSGIYTREQLIIKDVLHAADIEVDESGTVAAAATAVTFRLAIARIEREPLFIADHPFLFLIRDTVAGNILFMGRVTDPR